VANGQRFTKMRYGSVGVISAMWPPDANIETVHSIEGITVKSTLCGAAPSTASESALQIKRFAREGSNIDERATDETFDSLAASAHEGHEE
jgi:hypothetical protein